MTTDLEREWQLLVDGVDFGEGPRWRDGTLWYSDFYQRSIYRVTADGVRTAVFSGLEDRPSGMGWLPDGTLVVVFMTTRRVMRDNGDGTLVEHADLSGVATWHCNDMVVDAHGNIYVGNFGFDLESSSEFQPADLALVRPDGSVEVAATALAFPNGSVITPDGNTLIVGQTFGGDYLAYPINADATLGERRQWAEIPGTAPDGCTLDSAGGIWFSDALGSQVVRVEEGGNVTHRVPTPQPTFACALGGDDGRTLHVLCAPGSHPDEVAGKAGRRDLHDPCRPPPRRTPIIDHPSTRVCAARSARTMSLSRRLMGLTVSAAVGGAGTAAGDRLQHEQEQHGADGGHADAAQRELVDPAFVDGRHQPSTDDRPEHPDDHRVDAPGAVVLDDPSRQTTCQETHDDPAQQAHRPTVSVPDRSSQVPREIVRGPATMVADVGTAWVGFAGVALGAILGLLPRYWDMHDARRQRDAETERQRSETEARQHAHRSGMLMKVARTTNEFLAAWGHAKLGRGGDAEQRLDLQSTFDRGADMMASWSEALVVIDDGEHRRVIESTLRDATPHVGRAESLGDLAGVVDAGLARLLGVASGG